MKQVQMVITELFDNESEAIAYAMRMPYSAKALVDKGKYGVSVQWNCYSTPRDEDDQV